MDAKEERLVARLRHHNPHLTVTELRLGRVDRIKKKQVIDYLNSLRFKASVESCPGLDTVVSVDISTSSEQNDIFQKLLHFIRGIGIGDISITSHPFDERQPEIESTDSIQAADSSSRDYTPLNSEDIEELISRDKSESEFELILSRPRRQSSSYESSLLHSDQSSRDIIGSILRVSGSRGKSQNSDWSLFQHTIKTEDRSSKNSQNKKHHRKQNIWTRAKNLFKRKRSLQKKVVGQFQAMSIDSSESEVVKSKEKNYNIQRDMDGITKSKISLNTLQKRLEKVSRDVFSMKNNCSAVKSDGPSLDAYTQTLNNPIEEVYLTDTRTQTIDKNCSSKDPPIGRYYLAKKRSHISSTARSQSEISVRTESEKQVMMAGLQMPFQPLRGMVPNLLPLYPNMPANLKRPVMYQLKPVDGPFFFRRVTATKTSSHSTTTSFLTTSASTSIKSTRSTLTFSSVSVSSLIPDNENFIYAYPEQKYVSCGVACTQASTPFERERIKKTQTVEPKLFSAEINTSGVFMLSKITQTCSRKKRKRYCDDQKPLTQALGTQTFPWSSSTSCSELLSQKSCGTKTENDVLKVDKENSCNLIPKRATESKETISDTLVLKCESCQATPDHQAERKGKLPEKQRHDKGMKRGYGWGQYPDGNFGFGQTYAPGKVFPIISMTQGFPIGNPFTIAAAEKEINPSCPKICNLFGGKKRALMEELKKQKMELMQMRMVLVAINEELLAECTETSSDDNMLSSEDTYPSSFRVHPKQSKRVTFSEPLVNGPTLSYANHQ